MTKLQCLGRTIEKTENDRNGSTPEHGQGAVSMKMDVKAATTVGYGQTGVSLILHVSDTGGHTVWIGVLGAVGHNEKDSG